MPRPVRGNGGQLSWISDALQTKEQRLVPPSRLETLNPVAQHGESRTRRTGPPLQPP